MFQKSFTSQIFFFVCAAFTAILSWNSKNYNTIFTVSKIQTIRKLNPTTTSFAGLFLTVVRLTCLNDNIIVKIKKPFTLSFFL